jgi:DNA mismatch repair ATPase MutS
MANATPMMKQYRAIKNRHRDAILFFRLGDFYEMFEHDAMEASSLLDLTLTQRNGIPMCGIPYHASEGYIARLLKDRRLRTDPYSPQGEGHRHARNHGGDHPRHRGG